MVNKESAPVEPEELLTCSNKEPMDQKVLEEAVIRRGLKRLNMLTLASVAGQAVSHTDAMAKTLFRLGMQSS